MASFLTYLFDILVLSFSSVIFSFSADFRFSPEQKIPIRIQSISGKLGCGQSGLIIPNIYGPPGPTTTIEQVNDGEGARHSGGIMNYSGTRIYLYK